MTSFITLYPDLPLGSANYIIDDIETYLKQYETKELTREIQVVYPQLFNEVYLNIKNANIEVFKQYNYCRIIGSELIATPAYYFVRNVEYAALNNLKISLELDVLNTYNNQISFASNTFVIREHIDRWNYKGFYIPKDTNILYLLRNFHQDEDEQQLKQLIYSGDIYCDDQPILKLNNNYWVKLKVKDDIEGLKIYFLNLHYPFYILNGDKEAILIKGFSQYSAKELNIILQNNATIIEMSIIPYPPHKALKDVGLDPLYIDPTAFNDIFTVGYLSFKFEETTVTLMGICTNFYTSLLPLQRLRLPLNKMSNDINNVQFLNKLLFQSLVQVINNIDQIQKQLKQFTLFNNGVFSSNFEEKRDINNFYQVNEPSALKTNFFQINLHFLDYSFDIILENIKLKNSDDFKDICETNFITDYNPILSLNYKLFYFNDGGAFYIDNGKYCIYESSDKQGKVVQFFSILPSLSNQAIEYQKEAELKRLEEKNEKPKSIIDRVGELAEITKKYVSKAPAAIVTGLSRGISTFVRTGNTSKTLVSAGLGWLLTKEQDNNKVALSNTSFEAAITKNEFKLGCSVFNCLKVNTIQDLYYYQGNLLNINKIPTHNNRILFDYLQCEPVFLNHIKASSEIIEKIKQLFNNGVYYIHYYNGHYCFPYENLENFESLLVYYLTND